MASTHMKQYGLIGFPLNHSFSKKFFSEKFKHEGIDAQYTLFETDTLDKFISIKNMPALSGLNVTMPFKEKIIPFLDEIDDTARQIGSVNVIKCIRNGDKLRLKGFNSDMAGFTAAISPLIRPHHSKALILGTGGTSKSIDFGLKKMGIETKLVSRNPETNQLSYTSLTPEVISNHTIIVNTSPLGMYPDVSSCPEIPYSFLTNEHLIFDTVYNPAETLFLKKSKQYGATILNGEKMLICQALLAWEIWNK